MPVPVRKHRLNSLWPLPKAKFILPWTAPTPDNPAANQHPTLSSIPLRLARPNPNYSPAPTTALAGAPLPSAPSNGRAPCLPCRSPSRRQVPSAPLPHFVAHFVAHFVGRLPSSADPPRSLPFSLFSLFTFLTSSPRSLPLPHRLPD